MDLMHMDTEGKRGIRLGAAVLIKRLSQPSARAFPLLSSVPVRGYLGFARRNHANDVHRMTITV